MRTCTGRGALDSGAIPQPRHVTATRYRLTDDPAAELEHLFATLVL
jgi:hypothetical protein